MFEGIGTINHKPFSIALSASFSSSSEADDDDECDESFPKRGMLPRNKTLPGNVIVHTKIPKRNKTNNNSKLINSITVTKQEHSIHGRVERSVECGLTYALFYSLSNGYVT